MFRRSGLNFFSFTGDVSMGSLGEGGKENCLLLGPGVGDNCGMDSFGVDGGETGGGVFVGDAK